MMAPASPGTFSRMAEMATTVLFSLIDVNTGAVAQMRDHFFGPEGR